MDFRTQEHVLTQLFDQDGKLFHMEIFHAKSYEKKDVINDSHKIRGSSKFSSYLIRAILGTVLTILQQHDQLWISKKKLCLI